MGFKIKPFAEVILYTKEKLDEALAPIRVRSIKAKATMEEAKLEEKMLGLEKEIHEACASKEPDFTSIINKIDSYELTERKLNQIRKIIAEMFPKEK